MRHVPCHYPQRYYSEAVLAEKSRTELLEEALNRLSLESAPSADYLALGYLHLAMAHAVQGDHAAAAAAFAHINTLPADSPFVKLVTDLYLKKILTLLRSANGFILNRNWQIKPISNLISTPAQLQGILVRGVKPLIN